jgi:hypothetical protein
MIPIFETTPLFFWFNFLHTFIFEINQVVMKNSFLLFIASIFFPVLTLAQGVLVSVKQAETIAEKVYYERVQSYHPLDAGSIKVNDSFTVKEENMVYYYVFNFSSGGFVAIAAHTANPPVLCYAFTGKYDPAGQPENFRAWMDQYNRQIAFSIETGALPSPETDSKWKYYQDTPLARIRPLDGREVLPMLTSNWDQGKYYNEMCPADPSGPSGHCYTGCVATAIGQLMNYFRWPVTGTGSYTYECPPYGTLSADFGSSTYDWDLMAVSLSHSNPEVAQLLNHIGISVDMVYGPNGSGMYNHKGAFTLKTYFKYSPETRYVFRDSTTMDWDSLIVSHLDRKIPCYYAGWSVPDTNGHAFICDGYQEGNYYHFNWGWSGSYDGYFYTDNLTPGGNYFNLAQELIINAVPDTNLYDYPLYCAGEKNFNTLFGTIGDGSGPLYPYQKGAGCSWLIVPDDSVNSVTLNFLRFSTDPADIVTVYDGDSITAPVLGAFSGSEIPGPVTTTGNKMLVTFNSGPETTEEGFLASFESAIPVYCSGTTILTAQTDTLSDGSGSWDYHDNSACLWRIMPEGASSVTLYFEEFETEAGFDLLKIYDLQTQQLLAEYSGSYAPGVPEPVTSPSGKMFIAFSTNFATTAPGWKAYYESNLVNVKEFGLKEGELLVFPNPSNGLITIQKKGFSASELKIRMADLSGRNVSFNEKLNQGDQVTLDIRALSPGIYILTADPGKGNSEYRKIIKR